MFSDKQLNLFNENLLSSHIQFLKTLQAEGHLMLCGPFCDNQGAMFIIKAISEAAAINLIQNDPFIKKGYYRAWIIHEFTEANEENNWLVTADQTINNLKNI